MDPNCGFLPYEGRMAKARGKNFMITDPTRTAKGQVRYMDVMARDVNGKQMMESR